MEAEITKPDAEKRGRGRPAGSGLGLTASRRAAVSRRKRRLEGEKRIEVMIGEDARLALMFLQKLKPDATIREIIENALIDTEKRSRMR